MSLSDIFKKWLLDDLTQEIKKAEVSIMASLQELEAKIAELSTKVDADVAQGAAVIVAINELLKKIPASADYQPQIDALNAIIAKVTSDNPAIQAAIDAANAQP